MNLTADDGFNIVKHIRQIDFHLIQLNLATLNTAHIQYIINKGQQMISGSKNFLQIVLYFFRI